VDKTRYLVDIEKKGRFDYFFSGTDIHRNPTPEKSSYLVFKLNFSVVSPNMSEVEGSFLHYIKKSVSGFVRKYGSLLDIDVKEAQEELKAGKFAIPPGKCLTPFMYYTSLKNI
jgi:hypothetical protein